MRYVRFWICATLIVGLIGVATAARAGDDTARFYGTWKASVLFNGQMVANVSVHDASGYKNYAVAPSGDTPAGDGTFSAANGRYTTSAEQPNDSGTYHFLGDDTVIYTNAAGQTVTWKREKAGLALAPAAPPSAAPAAALTPDPSLAPETNAAIAAFNQKDYNTAWRDFMAAAQKGDSEAHAGAGAMLFNHLNPPGTGYYAQCEKWLLASANQGNAKGMDFLAQYYYATAVAEAGGINPGNTVPEKNNARVPPALGTQLEGRFALARQWFERAAAKNDGYAIGNLAIMLDSGVGGPADPARAAQLRERLRNRLKSVSVLQVWRIRAGAVHARAVTFL